MIRFKNYTKEEETGQRKRLNNNKNKISKFIIITFLLVYPIIYFVVVALPQWWTFYTKSGIQAYEVYCCYCYL